MPTVDVTSPALTPSARLKAALNLTRWLTNHGSDAAHVVVAFHTADPMAYFVRGVPLTTFDDPGGDQRRAPWASVVCHVHPDRDAEYRAGLAEEIRRTLCPEAGTGHLMVRFEPTRPDHVLYRDGNTMTSGAPAPAGAGPTR
ncbi:hypothetical protein [Streptomyces sp. NBC_00388]|uniref:hypothetical protein n=1 Tax=Streptomyces sp. NBC_00388 TaxID=2975735 RepID=UPI002E1A8F41